MKHLAILLALVALPACSSDHSASPRKNTLAHKAYHYYGLDERRDRKLIKEIMGVDPVNTEWCAAFVNMILLEQGLPTSASVSEYPLMARSFLLWGERVTGEPEQGDIVVFERGNEGWQGHVAFYVSRTIIDGEVYFNVIGGNQNNKVSIESYPVNKLLDIRRLSSNTESRLSSIY